jgi:hypothetical protein
VYISSHTYFTIKYIIYRRRIEKKEKEEEAVESLNSALSGIQKKNEMKRIMITGLQSQIKKKNRKD